MVVVVALVRMNMRMGVVVRVGVTVPLPLPVFMGVVVVMVIVVMMVGPDVQRSGRIHLHVDRRDPALGDACYVQPLPPRTDRIERLADHVDRNAEIDEGPERHVAGDAARAVEVQVQALHAGTAMRAMRTAATAAPTPLSMLTTVMPGAHEVSMAPSAISPSIATP